VVFIEEGNEMRRWFLVAVVAMVSVSTATARLGEKPAQCEARYGPVVHESHSGRFTVRAYKKAGMLVRIHYVTKKDMVFAFKEAVAISYHRPSESANRHISLRDVEISKLLGVNAQGKRWQKLDFVKKAAELGPGPEQSQLIHENNMFLVWNRSDGATAHYMKKTHELVIRLTPKVPLPVEEKAPEILEGF